MGPSDVPDPANLLIAERYCLLDHFGSRPPTHRVPACDHPPPDQPEAVLALRPTLANVVCQRREVKQLGLGRDE